MPEASRRLESGFVDGRSQARERMCSGCRRNGAGKGYCPSVGLGLIVIILIWQIGLRQSSGLPIPQTLILLALHQ
jgi:hypothetical protein